MTTTVQERPRTHGSRPRWGTPAWFDHLLRSQGEADPSAYYALSGYHCARHEGIAAFLEGSRLPHERTAMLDIGCGAGHMTALLRRRLEFRETVAIDFVPDLIERVRRRYPQIRAEVGNPIDLRFRSGEFDLVVAAEVLYYLDAEGRLAALEEIRRVLKPGGVFLFTSALGDRYFSRESAHEYVASRFHIIATDCPCHRLYHMTVGRLSQLRRLDDIVNHHGEPGSPESVRRLESLGWLTRNRAFRTALRMVGGLSEPVLRARWIPRIMERACRLVAPQFSQTNINILAQKDS